MAAVIFADGVYRVYVSCCGQTGKQQKMASECEDGTGLPEQAALAGLMNSILFEIVEAGI
jgi:hypothetical protein